MSPSHDRIAQRRRYLMCRPDHFTVSYRINPWMEPARPTDTAKAVAQWETLYNTYLTLGHEVELIGPVEGLPDMVYTANGGFVIDGSTAVACRFISSKSNASPGSKIGRTTPSAPATRSTTSPTACAWRMTALACAS